MPAGGRKEAEVVGEVSVVAGMVSPAVRSSASRVWPSVARMNLASPFAVAGLRSGCNPATVVPSRQTAMWMLLRWSTPPGTSEALFGGAQAPERGVLVAERGPGRRTETQRIKGLKRQAGDGLFDSYGVQVCASAPRRRSILATAKLGLSYGAWRLGPLTHTAWRA